MSRLKHILESGAFAVTAECGPPKGADPGVVLKKAEILRGRVDAVNVTDNQTAIVRMSSLAACSLLKGAGLDPVLQTVVRDRNRIALQSDILGASALGIRNVLCLSGDHPCFGNQPQALGVFDLDSIQFLQAVKAMRDEARILGGDPLSSPPDLFIGARPTPSPTRSPSASSALRRKSQQGPSSSRPSASTTSSVSSTGSTGRGTAV